MKKWGVRAEIKSLQLFLDGVFFEPEASRVDYLLARITFSLTAREESRKNRHWWRISCEICAVCVYLDHIGRYVGVRTSFSSSASLFVSGLILWFYCLPTNHKPTSLTPTTRPIKIPIPFKSIENIRARALILFAAESWWRHYVTLRAKSVTDKTIKTPLHSMSRVTII